MLLTVFLKVSSYCDEIKSQGEEGLEFHFKHAEDSSVDLANVLI